MALVHLPALGRVGYGALHAPADREQILALTGLALTVGFFALKLIDVRFLRLGGHRGTGLAFILACAVIHHDAAITEAGRAAIGRVPAALATVLIIEALRRSDHLWRRVRRGFASAVGSSSAAPVFGTPVFAARALPPQWFIECCPFEPRPPPAR